MSFLFCQCNELNWVLSDKGGSLDHWSKSDLVTEHPPCCRPLQRVHLIGSLMFVAAVCRDVVIPSFLSLGEGFAGLQRQPWQASGLSFQRQPGQG